jgi:hypothetical protein
VELTARLLLDTHALLWTLLDPDRIPATTLELIRAPDTELLANTASSTRSTRPNSSCSYSQSATVERVYRAR